jgi:hypothetical protein
MPSAIEIVSRWITTARLLGGVALTITLFAVLMRIYASSPINTSFDSLWSIHTAASLLRGHAGELSEYAPILQKHRFYAVKYCGGQPRTIYPIGVSILAAPAVAHKSRVDPGFNDFLREHIPNQFEKVIASFYGALAGVLFFWLIFAKFRSVAIALGATIVFAFGTSMWSTATRALWQHGPLVLMIIIAMLLLLRARAKPSLTQYAGLPLAFAFVIRPTAAIPIFLFSAYVLIYYRPWLIRYLLWASAIAIPWLAFNLQTCGTLVPGYYQITRMPVSPDFGEALLGHLISPARGLLVFSPVLILALSGFLIALKDRDERPLSVTFGLCVVLHWLLISRTHNWWAGHCFGPRFMTDVLPFLCYFVAFNFRPATSAWKTAAVAAGIGVLALTSIFIHSRGAWEPAVWLWNVSPNNIDRTPARLWDWRDLQFMRRTQ